MAIGYETNTQTENYVMREPDYTDMSQDEFDGEDLIRYSFLMHYPTASELGHVNMYEHRDTPEAQTFLPYGATNLFRQAETFLHFTEGIGGVIAESAGVHIQDRSDTTPGGKRLELTYPSAEQANESLARLNLPEGTFPTFVNLAGEQYQLEDFVRAIAEDKVLLSDQGWGAAHDALFHIPAWALAPPELRTVFADQARKLVAAYDAIASSFDMRNEAHRYIQQSLKSFGTELDELMNSWNFAEVAISKTDASYERSQTSKDRVSDIPLPWLGNTSHWLEPALHQCGIDPYSTEGKQQIADLEAAIIRHTKAVYLAADNLTI